MRLLPSVSIIILNWNAKQITDKCLTSLFDCTSYPKTRLSIVIVDNGSTDNSVCYFRDKYQSRINLIESKNNVGFIKGCNLGIKYAAKKFDSDYYCLLNNDIEITEDDWLSKLIDIGQSDEQVGIIGPKLVFPNGRIQWCGRRRESNVVFLMIQTLTARFNPGFGVYEHLDISANFIGEVNTISGACMLIKSKVIKKLGLLDPVLVPMYQEDVEYSFRAWRAGFKVVYRGDVKLVHYEGYTTENNKVTEKQYWALRNSIIVSLKYFGILKVVFIGLPIYISISLFDKKTKTQELSVFNIKKRENIKNSLRILLISLRDALMRYKYAI